MLIIASAGFFVPGLFGLRSDDPRTLFCNIVILFRPLIQNKLEVLGKAGLSEDVLEADCTFFKVSKNLQKLLRSSLNSRPPFCPHCRTVLFVLKE